MKPSWEMTEADVEACLKDHHMVSTPPTATISPWGGFSKQFPYPWRDAGYNEPSEPCEGLGRCCRLPKGGLSISTHQKSTKCSTSAPTRPGLPHGFVPRLCPGRDAFKDVYSVMNNWEPTMAQYLMAISVPTSSPLPRFCVSLCACTMSLTPRYSVRRHGTRSGMDKVGADYRACQNYGPIYK